MLIVILNWGKGSGVTLLASVRWPGIQQVQNDLARWVEPPCFMPRV